MFSLHVHAQSYCVVRSGAVLHRIPKKSAPVSWRVSKFMPLQGTGKQRGAFVEVIDVDGEKHWALKKDLSTKVSCLVVKTRGAKLRKGPGTNYEISSTAVADKYEAFLDYGGEEGWTLVEDQTGVRSWIDLSQTWKPKYKMRLSFESQ